MNGATASPARLDDDNPWPGLEAFDEASRGYFHGRDDEVGELLRRVEQSPLTVLFGKSGLGKTSLLKAGLLPPLREKNFLPIYVRLDFHSGAPAPVAQLRDALRDTLVAERIDVPAIGADENLWAYLHRAGLEFWNQRNFPCTPVFVLDQFEEVFTLGEHQPEGVSRFRIDLGDLAENRIPAELRATDSLVPSVSPMPALLLRTMSYKFLISLREDYLPELEGWRAAIPSLGKVRMRLLPLQLAQALAAVHQAAPHLMDERLARRIVDFVAVAQAEQLAHTAVPDATESTLPPCSVAVEPALLSLFCRGLNERRRQQHEARFDDVLLDDAKLGILTDYYRSCFEDMPESVSRFVATELITEKGYRNSVAKDDATPAYVSEAQLSSLINRRLLRVEERYGTQCIELTHDLLTHVVREHRDRLRHEEEQAAEIRQADAERQAFEQRLQSERQAERERQLEAEARSGRRFKWLALTLAFVLILAIGAGTLSVYQWAQATQAGLDARRQRDIATIARKVADSEGLLAQQRLQRITDSIGMKQAVLSGDHGRILRYLDATTATSAVRFTAKADPLGYNNQQGKPVYLFSLMPTPDTLSEVKQKIAMITYRMDHPTFENSLLATGAERGFRASYNGWGCLRNVVVLVEYVDPDRQAEIAAYDMCAALGW